MSAVTERSAPAARGRAPHPARAEAVRGFAPFAGAAVLLTVGVMTGYKADEWQGDWGATAALLHTGLLILIPLAAAAGCWQGGRERRRRTEELWATAARPPLPRFLASALPTAAWVALGYLTGVALALLACRPYALGGGPRLGLLPGDTVALVAASLTGQVLGRVVPTRLAAPLLALAGYVGLGLLERSPADPSHELSPARLVGDAQLPVWWQPAAMAAWTGGLALAAVLAYTARRRVTALLPLAAAVAAGVLLVQTGDGLWRPDPLSQRQVCDTSTTPAICVNARYAGLLPQVKEALSGITDKLEGVENLPERWDDLPGGPDDRAHLPMVTPIGRSVVRGRLTDPRQYAWEAAAALEGHGNCDDPRVAELDELVEHYLAPSPGESHFDDLYRDGTKAERAEQRREEAGRARLAAMSAGERRDWLSAYFATTGRCDVKGVPAL
ncbi:hypothetical protein ABT131_11310 [Streptomyces sp900105245]|uniref:hypothetical protein n=1 Tax=Streptomyces sp. 900105245 TaxID=3154379 RepID=UPI00331A1EC0